MRKIDLECKCGNVKGRTSAVTAATGNRVICCCDDCQAFAKYLGEEDSILDEYGGTDICQLPVSYLRILEGVEYLACLKLSPKGLFRWYTKCCNTAIGNTMGRAAPFIGVIHSFIKSKSTIDKDLGEVRGHIQTEYAKKRMPQELQVSSFPIVLRSLSKLVIWKVKGLNKPSVFFDDQGESIAPPIFISQTGEPTIENR